MLNKIWFALFFFGYLVAGATGRVEATTRSLLLSLEQTTKFTIGIIGFLAFWSGLLRIAEEAGLTQILARLLQPVLRYLFPNIPAKSPALGAVSMSISANLLGLSNASTPLGLKAIHELNSLNPTPQEISEEIAVYLALVMGGLSFFPSTIIALRTQAGSVQPMIVLGPIFLATLSGTAGALAVHYFYLKWFRKKGG